mgnify:CR=1 FL=1
MAYQMSCQDAGIDCDFMIRSEDRDELVSFVQQHAKDVHDSDMSKSEIQNLLSSA